MSKKYGLVGCGMMGLEHIKNVALLEGGEISRVFDPVAERIDLALGLAPQAKATSSIDSLASDPEVDAVIIASPNHLHIDHLETIARTRALPILCEKPLYTNAADLSRIDTLERNYAAPIWVAMEYRYMPPIAKMIERAEDETGGIKMLSMVEHRFPFLPKVGDWNRFNAKTGGTFVEKCCHFFDLMRLMLQSEPVSVFSTAGQITNHLDESYDGAVPDIWDGGYVVFDFANGARAMLELAMFVDGSKWNEEIHAIGPKGKIACRLPGPQRFWPEDLGPPPDPELSIYPRYPKNPQTEIIALDSELVEAGDHHGSTFFQHQKFLEMIVSGGTPEVSLSDGKAAVQMGLMAQMAATERRLVRTSETATISV